MKASMRSLMLSLAVLFVGFGLSACKKPEYPACKKDKHCKQDAGEKCVDGTCQNCTTDEECAGKGPNGENWVCHEFRCTDPAQVGAGGQGGGEEGAPCTQRSDCVGGLACKGGVCSLCSEDIDCAPSTCNLETGRCSPEGQCQTDDDCAMDEICDAGMCIFSGNLGQEGTGKCGLDAVYFAFDSDKLTPSVQEQLQTAAECIKNEQGMVYLEAHADRRGTEEYNIMLTERRGQSVKKYLENLGVPPDKMQVIAKGNLEATGTDEASMAKDRRVQFIWSE
ncbi:MAG: hypothetical protein D6705_14135 [Deltaproteobacteria bacterium]|nr:MAG: hypothetical protein D6705_14135 [Deltaproteobacteria bacterium]